MWRVGLLMVGFAALAAAQGKAPDFEVNLRGFRLAPGMRVEPPAKGACAIPLLQVLPKAEGTIRQAKPREGVGAMRIFEPPAPACESWNEPAAPVFRIEPREEKAEPLPRR